MNTSLRAAVFTLLGLAAMFDHSGAAPVNYHSREAAKAGKTMHTPAVNTRAAYPVNAAIAALPTITSFSPASGPVGTLVTINGTNLSAPTAFTIGGQSAIAVSNTGSVLVGMVMPGAVTGTVSVTTSGGTATSSGSFTVIAAKAPAAQQGPMLVGTGSAFVPEQGASVSVSADGNTAIVGGEFDNASVGAAWVYTRSGGAWAQQGSKLVGTGSIGKAGQGGSVSLSADGNTAIVSGPGDNSNIGAVWVYARGGGTWSQQGSKLVGTGSVGAASQGVSVSLSADGNTAIVGGINDNSEVGAAWVFTRSGSTWAQQGSKLVGTGSAGASDQGRCVSISADGNTVIVGGDGDNSDAGAAWVYTRSGGAWAQQGAKLVGTGSAGVADQGEAVSLSADGNTAMVGGNTDNSGVGAVWVFTRSGGAWAQQGSKLVGSAYVGSAREGWSVSLSADGNTAVVGGPSDNNGVGATWVYTRSGGAWAQPGPKLMGTGSTGQSKPGQGDATALSADGSTAIVGGPSANSEIGAAWVFTASPNALLAAIKLSPAAALLNTGTTGSTTTYTASVANAVASVTVTPTAQDAGATIKVNGAAVSSGAASGPVALAEGAATTINTIVTASDGTTTRTYAIAVTRAPSSNALLNAISINPFSTLTNTGTVGSTTTYTGSIGNAIASVMLTPTAADANAAITVNGAAVASGAASGPIVLPGGQGASTTITVVVTAQDGTTTHTYTVTLTHAISSDALLSGLTLTPASVLTNTGTTGSTTTYTASVSNATTSVMVTPTTADPAATVKVNGATVSSGTASAPITIAPGAPTTITIVVTAQDGTTHTYAITTGNALLSSIALTPSSVLTNTGTTGSTTTYTTTVSNTTASVRVTPVTNDPNSTITVNGATVSSGTASGPIAVGFGKTTINTIVTAQGFAAVRSYAIIVTRLSTNALLSSIKLNPDAILTNTGTSGSTTTYSTTESNPSSSVTVTPVTQDPNATVTVNGMAVASGTASASIALAIGSNTITIAVTAQDPSVTRNYVITVTRASGPILSLRQPVSLIQPADDVAIENDGVLVHQGVTPNGDGINDVLTIDGILAYPDNQLTIVDRSGALIFQAWGYNNISKVFDGHSSINGRMQQPGTYFYALDYVAGGQNRRRTGYILLKY